MGDGAGRADAATLQARKRSRLTTGGALSGWRRTLAKAPPRTSSGGTASGAFIASIGSAGRCQRGTSTRREAGAMGRSLSNERGGVGDSVAGTIRAVVCEKSDGTAGKDAVACAGRGKIATLGAAGDATGTAWAGIPAPSARAMPPVGAGLKRASMAGGSPTSSAVADAVVAGALALASRDSAANRFRTASAPAMITRGPRQRPCRGRGQASRRRAGPGPG